MSAAGPSASSSTSHLVQRKAKRVGRACDRCHRFSSKCAPGPTPHSSCMRCAEDGALCTYDRPAKRRGPPQGRTRRGVPVPTTTTGTSLSGSSHQHDPPSISPPSRQAPTAQLSYSRHDPVRSVSPLASAALQPPVLTAAESPSSTSMLDHVIVEYLTEAYYHFAYALMPLCHWPTFSSMIRAGKYRTDRGQYAVTMAMCSLAAGRLRDGARPPPVADPPRFNPVAVGRSCYHESLRVMPDEMSGAGDAISWMKAKALLSATAMHSGYLERALLHLGDYIALSTNIGFHFEANWPKLDEVQRQERRRLYWCVYQYDHYLSNIFGLVSRHRESRSTVLYPAEVYDDTDITPTEIRYRPDQVSFLRGWNYCTDLYRLLEHMSERSRARQTPGIDEPGALVTSLLNQTPRVPSGDILQLLVRLHDDLPIEFKQVKPMTGEAVLDRFGFLAINVLITSKTLRMYITGEDNSSVHMRCAIVGDLLDALADIPMSYFHSSSTTVLWHLAGIGYLLATAAQKPLSAWTNLQVRNILLVLADFESKMEEPRATSPALSSKIKSQIARIESFMPRSAPPAQEFQANPSVGGSMGQDTVIGGRTHNHVDLGPNMHSSPSTGNRLIDSLLDTSMTGQFGNPPPLDPLLPMNGHQLPMTGSGDVINGLNGNGENGMTNGNMALATNPVLQLGEFDFAPMNGGLLPADMFNDWPFDLNQSQAFDFFGTSISPRDVTSVNGSGGHDDSYGGQVAVNGSTVGPNIIMSEDIGYR